jgi:sodium-coupled neutral amino acid transporter 11
VKSVLGCGVFCLPGAVAAGHTGIIPGVILTAAFGAASGYSFALIGRCCAEAGVTDFRALAEKTYGIAFARMLNLVLILKCFTGCLAFSIVITDSCTAILRSFGFGVTRTGVLLGTHAGVLLPLCLMRDLSALAYTSVLGTGGMVYTALFMLLRTLDGSYGMGGRFSAGLAARRSMDIWSIDVKTLVLVAILSTSYIAHYNAPKFYQNLKDRTVVRFNRVVYLAFAIITSIFILIVSTGYLTFGTASAGFVLNNYAATDPLATAARVAVGGSLVCAYPLVFTGLRDGLRNSMNIAAQMAHRRLSYSTLIALTLVAFVAKDVGFVSAISGALFGTLLMFVFPGMFLMRANPKPSEKKVAKGLVASGVVIGWLSLVVSVIREYFPALL